MERFNLKKLNEVEGKEHYHVEISNRFSALENLNAEVDINRAWETITESINISAKESLGYYELKMHKPWFVEGCSELLDQRKQAKLQWLQDSNSNYLGISLLSTSYKMLSNILLSRLSPYIGEIIGDHQCGFRRNSSNTNQIFLDS
jgi:hypothetical protein